MLQGSLPLRSGSMRVLRGKTGWLLCGALLLKSGVPVWGQSAGTASSATSQTQSDKRELLQEEVGDRDLTYLRTRAVFQYDYKEQVEDVTINRARLKLLYAFGLHQNMAVSVMVHRDAISVRVRRHGNHGGLGSVRE
jgi:hypothetical protein